MQPNRSTLILVFGILSLIICAPLGIAAWIMGNKDLAGIAAGTVDPANKELVTIGRILGIIGTVIFGLGVLFVLFWGGLGVFAALLSGGGAH